MLYLKNDFREKLYSIKHFFAVKNRNEINKKYTAKQRKRLKNDNFSIISSNCIGGFIYHRLGKQFLSPTINLYFNQKEFIKFAQNLRYYITLPLEFIETDFDFPVAKIGDITLYFLHYSNNDEAKEAWERRKTRINYDNLYLIVYDKDGLTDDDYKAFGQINFKTIIIISYNENNNYSYFKKIIKKNSYNDNKYFIKDKNGIRTFEEQWDFVDWLNKSS